MKVILERVGYPTSLRTHWRAIGQKGTICGLADPHETTGWRLILFPTSELALCKRCQLVRRQRRFAQRAVG